MRIFYHLCVCVCACVLVLFPPSSLPLFSMVLLFSEAFSFSVGCFFDGVPPSSCISVHLFTPPSLSGSVWRPLTVFVCVSVRSTFFACFCFSLLGVVFVSLPLFWPCCAQGLLPSFCAIRCFLCVVPFPLRPCLVVFSFRRPVVICCPCFYYYCLSLKWEKN